MLNMMLLRAIFILLIIQITSPIIKAQDPAHSQLTDENGLPSMTVYQIEQDKKGYVWIGTENGICSYDGKVFVNYSHRLMNDNEIINIEIDKYNNVWFRNLSNQVFLIQKGIVTPIMDMINKELIYDFCIIDDYIYLIYPLSVTTEKQNENKLVRYKINQDGKFSDEFRFEINFDSWKPLIKVDNSLEFSFTNKVVDQYTKYKIENGNKKPFKINTQKQNIKNYSNYSTHKFHQNQILLYRTYSNREIFKLENGKISSFLTLGENNIITNISKINDRSFILTKKGIIIEDDEQRLTKNSIVFKGINCNILFADNENNLWVGTTGHGIIFIPSLEIDIYNSKNSNLANDQIFSLDWDRQTNDLYVGHNEAKFSIVDSLEIYNYNINASGRILDITIGQNNTFLAIDSKSIIIQNIDKQRKQFSTIKEIDLTVKTFFIDSKKRIFIGYNDRAQFYKNEDDLINRSKSTKKLLINKRTYAIAEDARNDIWIGTTEGIYIYSGDKVEALSRDKKNTFYVSSIVQGVDSIMWISTLSEGIIGYKDYKEVMRFNIENGLSSNTCKKLATEGDNLWIATNNGLNIINQKNGVVKTINKNDGLPSNDISDVIVTDSEVWLGTSKGLVNFPKNLNHLNETSPNIYLTALKIWEKDTILLNSYELNYNQNNFQIEFTGIGFRSLGNITYQYKLNGVDEKWVTTDSRTVRYPMIKPGEYTFEVFAINEDGIKSKEAAIVLFSIASPWWLKWWFWAMMLLLFVGIISALFYWRLQQVKEKNRIETSFSKKVIALEQRALQLQMNPHFIYNTLNAIQYFLTVNDSKFAMIYLSRFAKMIRIIFEHSKRNTITLEEEIDFLNVYLTLEKLRFKDKVEVEFNVSEKIKKLGFELKIPPLLLQPLIENAFKHGLFQKEEKGLIKVDFNLENQFLMCTIEDDGVGRIKAKEKDSWKPKSYISSGINTTKERLKMLNESSETVEESDIQIIDLFNDNNKPCGTKVIVKIKCTE